MSEHPISFKRNITDSPDEPKRSKKSVIGLIVLIAAVLIVCLIICCVLFPHIFNFDVIGRRFTYFGKSDSETVGQIRFDSNSTDSYAVFNGHFTVGCEDGLYVYDDSGDQIALVQGSLPYPKICTCDSIALCYSNESSTLIALDKKGTSVLDTAAGGTLLDAEVSADGCICYAASDSGCKTLVTVLNKDRQEIYKWKSFSRYINCCAVSDGAKRLAVVGLGQEDSVFCSVLSILRTDSENDAVITEVSLGNQIIYELWYLTDKRICAIGETSVMFFDADGNSLQSFDYDGMTLTDFAASKNGTLFLSFDQNKSGTASMLVSLNDDGDVLAEREFAKQIDSISVNGKYLAVLTEDFLCTCSQKLESFDETSAPMTANRVLARKDGTVYLVGNGQATLYIP